MLVFLTERGSWGHTARLEKKYISHEIESIIDNSHKSHVVTVLFSTLSSKIKIFPKPIQELIKKTINLLAGKESTVIRRQIMEYWHIFFLASDLPQGTWNYDTHGRIKLDFRHFIMLVIQRLVQNESGHKS